MNLSLAVAMAPESPPAESQLYPAIRSWNMKNRPAAVVRKPISTEMSRLRVLAVPIPVGSSRFCA